MSAQLDLGYRTQLWSVAASLPIWRADFVRLKIPTKRSRRGPVAKAVAAPYSEEDCTCTKNKWWAKLTRVNDQAIRRALEAAGVEFVDENGGGPGARLRKRQQAPFRPNRSPMRGFK